MQKDSESADAHPVGDASRVLPINGARPDHDIRQAEFLAIFFHDFVLLGFGKRVGVAAQLRPGFNRAGFIQNPRPGFPRVRINGERTDVDEALEATVAQGRLNQIAGRNHRIHEGVRHHVTPAGGEMVNDGDITGGSGAIRW